MLPSIDRHVCRDNRFEWFSCDGNALGVGNGHKQRIRSPAADGPSGDAEGGHCEEGRGEEGRGDDDLGEEKRDREEEGYDPFDDPQAGQGPDHHDRGEAVDDQQGSAETIVHHEVLDVHNGFAGNRVVRRW